ncbi:hypothetical protein I3843_09G209100 [Carya illinoinensis]|nr:hypothetical protein I3843_09G209100 [Carya illinoinensis]
MKQFEATPCTPWPSCYWPDSRSRFGLSARKSIGLMKKREKNGFPMRRKNCKRTIMQKLHAIGVPFSLFQNPKTQMKWIHRCCTKVEKWRPVKYDDENASIFKVRNAPISETTKWEKSSGSAAENGGASYDLADPKRYWRHRCPNRNQQLNRKGIIYRI